MWRPVKGYDSLNMVWQEEHLVPSLDYLSDDRFACQAEMQSLVTTARMIMDDLYEVFNYLEPDDGNLNVYSHRIYELLLRTATEVESSFKGILKANGYGKAEKDMSMLDYFKIARAARLYEYKVVFDRWATAHEFKPFVTWNAATYTPLAWYQGYNNVKHNRYSYFKQANLQNLINTVAALLSILYAQYGENMAYGFVNGLSTSQSTQERLVIGLFTITLPTYPDAEQYDFIGRAESRPSASTIFYLLAMEEDNSLSFSMQQTIDYGNLEFVQEIGEIMLDTVLNDGVLKDLPILGAIVGVGKCIKNVYDIRFAEKLIAFLIPIKDEPSEKRATAIR